MDISGDGRTDLVFHTNTNAFLVGISNGQSFGNPLNQNWLSYSGLGTGTSAYPDLNGDGRADVAFHRDSVNEFHVALSTGSSYASAGLWLTHGPGPAEADYADVDGDGRDDLIFRNDSNDFYVSLSTGTGFGPPSLWADHGGSLASGEARYADLDGDQRFDLVYRSDQNEFFVHLSTGSSFSPGQPWVDHAGSLGNGEVYLADFNGDGLTDFAFRPSTNISISTGTQFAPQQSWTHPTGFKQAQFADMNGDGREDLVYQSVQNDIYVHYSLGNAFGPGSVWTNTNAPYGAIQPADADGDGHTDLAFQFAGGGIAVSSRGGKPIADRIVAIRSGVDLEHFAIYRPLTETAIYQKGSTAAYPIVDIQDSRLVVEKSISNNGIGGHRILRAGYTELKYNARRGNNLGFASVAITDEARATRRLTTYHQDFPLAGAEKRVELRDVLGLGPIRTLSETTLSWSTAHSGSIYRVQQPSQVESIYDGNGSLVVSRTTLQTFDEYNNTLSATLAASDGYSQTTTSSYSNDVANWLIGLPTATSVEGSAPGLPSTTRTTTYAYDSRGLRTRVTVEPGTSLELDTNYVLDAFGNPTSETTTGAGIVERVSTQTYTSSGTYVTSATNPLLHSESYTFDARHGVMSGSTDVNQLVSSYSHDPLGRPVLENASDGTTVEQEWFLCAAAPLACPANGVISVRQELLGAPPVHTVTDELGREVRRSTIGLDGQVVHTDTEYDAAGHLRRRSLAYFDGDAVQWTTFTYDVLDRPISRVEPDGAMTTWVYTGLSTQITNAKSQVQVEVRNSRGELMHVTDAGGNVNTYLYDGFGNAVQITSPAASAGGGSVPVETVLDASFGEDVIGVDGFYEEYPGDGFDWAGSFEDEGDDVPVRTVNRFDLSSIPSGAPIVSASLRISVDSVQQVASEQWRVGAYGANGQGDPQADDAETAFTGAAISPAAAYAAAVTEFRTPGIHTIPLAGTALADLEAARAGSGTFALSIQMIGDQNAGPDRLTYFDEYTASNPPQLVVVYEADAPPTPDAVLSAAFGEDVTGGAGAYEEYPGDGEDWAGAYEDGGDDFAVRTANRFDLSSIPSGAQIAGIALRISVDSVYQAGSEQWRVGPYGSGGQGDPDSDDASTAFTRAAVSGSAAYADGVTEFRTPGIHTIPLTGTAVADLEAALAGSGTFALAIQMVDDQISGAGRLTIFEEYSSANPPQLIVSFEGTLPPPETMIEATYDRLGRKTVLSDPDVGTQSMTYNVLGEMIQTTDAKGQVWTVTYDKLGRSLVRTEADGETTWTYDTAAVGVGKLATVSGTFGATSFAKTFSYDSQGRPSQVSNTLDGRTYGATVTYDALGRASNLTYPGGFETRRVYNTLGHLEEVENAATGQAYWTAQEQNAAGQYEGELLGNGITSRRVYNPLTREMTALQSGPGTSATVQDLAFEWDPIGNLTKRADNKRSLEETFSYDALNRLVEASIPSRPSLSYTYDAAGNILTKSNVGSYTYGAAAGPHAVTSVTGAAAASYAYDANGNQIQKFDGSGTLVRSVQYTSFDKPSAITRATATGLSFSNFRYDESRALMVRSDFDAITDETTTTYFFEGIFEEKILDDGTTELRHYVAGGEGVVGVYTSGTAAPPAMRYLHPDHLGSIHAVTDESGAVLEDFSYDPFGLRRNLDWTPATAPIQSSFQKGYGGHEQLDHLELVHMGGRVYDPALARFTSADPFVGSPGSTQGFNRYSYVHNNPLTFTDPSGFNRDEPPPTEIEVIHVIGNATGGYPGGILPGVSVTVPDGPGWENYVIDFLRQRGLLHARVTLQKAKAVDVNLNQDILAPQGGAASTLLGLGAGAIVGGGIGGSTAYGLTALTVACLPCGLAVGGGLALYGGYQLYQDSQNDFAGVRSFGSSLGRVASLNATFEQAFGVGAFGGSLAGGVIGARAALLRATVAPRGAGGVAMARHHTSPAGLAGIRRDGAIRPSRSGGVDVEVEPFGSPRPGLGGPRRELGSDKEGAFVEFPLPPNAIRTYVGVRNTARIPTDQPFRLGPDAVFRTVWPWTR